MELRLRSWGLRLSLLAAEAVHMKLEVLGASARCPAPGRNAAVGHVGGGRHLSEMMSTIDTLCSTDGIAFFTQVPREALRDEVDKEDERWRRYVEQNHEDCCVERQCTPQRNQPKPHPKSMSIKGGGQYFAGNWEEALVLVRIERVFVSFVHHGLAQAIRVGSARRGVMVFLVSLLVVKLRLANARMGAMSSTTKMVRERYQRATFSLRA